MCDYEKFNLMTFDDLYRIINPDSEMTTRGIDTLLYCLHEKWTYGKIFSTEEHIKNEKSIIDILQKFNDIKLKRLFNDSRVRYPYRTGYLDGETGTMSALLVDSKFMLYNYLLQRGVEINLHTDLYIIFGRLISSNIDNSNINIPEDELKAIYDIINHIKSINPSHQLFNSNWWNDLQDKFISFIDINSSKSWWGEWNYEYSNLLGQIGFSEDRSLLEGWESSPEFNTQHLNYTPQNFNLIKSLFINDEYQMMGGYKEKYLKYKQKYLKLKKLFL